MSFKLYTDQFISSEGEVPHRTYITEGVMCLTAITTNLCEDASKAPVRPKNPNKGSKAGNDVSKFNYIRYEKIKAGTQKYCATSMWLPPIEYLCRGKNSSVMLNYCHLIALSNPTWISQVNQEVAIKLSLDVANAAKFLKKKQNFLPYLKELTEKVDGAKFPNVTADSEDGVDKAYFGMWNSLSECVNDIIEHNGLFPDYPRALAHLYLLSERPKWNRGLKLWTMATLLFLLNRTVNEWSRNKPSDVAAQAYFPRTIRLGILSTLNDASLDL
jgi:hypothetical protein